MPRDRDPSPRELPECPEGSGVVCGHEGVDIAEGQRPSVEERLDGGDSTLERELARDDDPRIDRDSVLAQRVDVGLVSLVGILVHGGTTNEADVTSVVHAQEMRDRTLHTGAIVRDDVRHAGQLSADRAHGYSVESSTELGEPLLSARIGEDACHHDESVDALAADEMVDVIALRRASALGVELAADEAVKMHPPQQGCLSGALHDSRLVFVHEVADQHADRATPVDSARLAVGIPDLVLRPHPRPRRHDGLLSRSQRLIVLPNVLLGPRTMRR